MPLAAPHKGSLTVQDDGSLAENGAGRPGAEVTNESGKQGMQRLNLGVGMSLGFEFTGAVFIFWFLGRLVDNWLGIEPWAQVIGSVIGWVGGTIHVYYAVQRRG